MNEEWRNIDADAHQAKAEAIGVAIDALAGVTAALDNIEQRAVAQTVAVLDRARERHDDAAKLVAVT